MVPKMSRSANATSIHEGFRRIRFESIDDLTRELDRLLELERLGRLQTTGNWTAGQIMAHLAAWIEYGYDGYPIKPVPWFLRWILKLRLKKFLEIGMPRGVKIPGIRGGTVGADPMATDKGIERLKRALGRLANGEEAKHDSPAFGKMSHADRIRLNLRHAELHLGYLCEA
jgi:Protein of unknown function (DUF1569)